MSVIVIIVFCILILLAYLFDISSKFTGIPSVILLLALGFFLKIILHWFNVNVPDLNVLLPILGSVGLILIVLEGSLELELTNDKKKLVLNSFLVALLPIVLLALLISYLFYKAGTYTYAECLLNAVPLTIISSAIAIPSVRNLNKHNKEFIVYESSFSDVLGVLLFNFLLVNKAFGMQSLLSFGLEMIINVVISFIATILLTLLLNRINHHIKFMPIIILVILIYELSKLLHLPGLIFILIFGIFLGNINLLKRFDWLKKLKPEKLEKEVHKFKDLTAEIAFMVRASFFILFGYLINSEEILNTETMLLSGIIFLSIIFLRFILLLLFKLPLLPLLFIAPRGLISILLFISIPANKYIPLINNSLLIQIILLTALFMMLGILIKKRNGKTINTITES